MGLSAKKRAYYEEHLEAWRTSGLTQEKYCEQANIAYGSFKSWPSKLKQNEPVKTSFVEAKLSEAQDFGAILQISLPVLSQIFSKTKSEVILDEFMPRVRRIVQK